MFVRCITQKEEICAALLFQKMPAFIKTIKPKCLLFRVHAGRHRTLSQVVQRLLHLFYKQKMFSIATESILYGRFFFFFFFSLLYPIYLILMADSMESTPNQHMFIIEFVFLACLMWFSFSFSLISVALWLLALQQSALKLICSDAVL